MRRLFIVSSTGVVMKRRGYARGWLAGIGGGSVWRSKQPKTD